MTGFARREGGDAKLTWIWEAKSVNGKGLDVRCRLPSGMEALESKVRAAVPRFCARGSVTVSLTLDRGERSMRLQVNRDMLEQLVRLTRELQQEIEAEPPRLDGLLAVRGVLETVEELDDPAALADREARMAEDLDQLMEQLAETRREEGARLKAMALAHLGRVSELTIQAAATAEAQPETLKGRLRRQLDELLEAETGVSEERLAQELALLITKSDIREELDRLTAHEAAARELLEEDSAIGRRLDFLCQEFNREANTLCSKAQDVGLTRIGLALKNAVEQLREQIQNIE